MDICSFAISAGEGTLLAYGTYSTEGMDAILGAIDYDFEARGLDTREHVTIIAGPADGTGE